MSNADILNMIGRTFEVQSLYQQALMQGDLSVRHAERRLALEREKRREEVQPGEAAGGSETVDMDLRHHEPMESQVPRREGRSLGRYRLSWTGGEGPALEMDDTADKAPYPHLDIHA
ncbi:MAG: hypothetical protein V4498_00910 [candidate division FCPU426 bacterium]